LYGPLLTAIVNLLTDIMLVYDFRVQCREHG